MITVIFSTREPNPKHVEHIKKSSGLHNKIEVLEFINNNDPNSKYYNGGESLTKLYNRGLKQAKNDIVVFCHDDLVIETKQWGHKLVKLFDKNPEFGVIGVAGSKNMPISGQWWENRNKMYGRVAHTSEGKTWLSSYSDDLGQNLEETVIVDGVFFAVNKNRIKKKFDETFEGFHFYDITFSFDNHLEGVKVGVTTVIRINHHSIGMTNEAWEANRVQFAEKNKEHLPANVKRVLHKGQKLRIHFGTMTLRNDSFKDKTVLELAKAYRKQGHDVTITCMLDGVMGKETKKHGIRLAAMQEPPGYKIGDGKWEINSPNGPITSIPKTLYKIADINFDVNHVFNDELVAHFKKLYPELPLFNTQYVDGLFVEETTNDLVNKTIKLKIDLNEIKKPELVEEIITDYIDAL
jgi:hypothetical protein